MAKATMLKLTAKGDKSNMVWYFNTVGDCDKFKGVFEKNGCIIDWNLLDIVDSRLVPPRDATDANMDPVQRGLIAISWAKNGYHEDKSTGITESQQDLIKFISMQNIEKDPEPVMYVDQPIEYKNVRPSDSPRDLGGFVCPHCHSSSKVYLDDQNVAHVEKCACGYVSDETMKEYLNMVH